MFIKFLETSQEAPVEGWVSLLITIVPFLLLGLVFYFMLIRPQKKQQKELSNMRESIAKGDIITTTGGIIGIVVNIKDDMVLIETGGDKTKIQIQKWAVRTVEQKKDE